jgi:hypothetical protein
MNALRILTTEISPHHMMSYITTVKPVKLATLVSRPPVIVGHIYMEPANSYDVHGRYSITWPPAYLESWPPFSRLVLCFMYKCNLPTLAILKILYFLCPTVYRPNPHLLYDRSTSILSRQVWTTVWHFLVGITDNYTSSPYSLTGLCTVPAFCCYR